MQRVLYALGLVMLVALASACHQNGTVFTVDTTLDTVDSNPGDGFCSDASGDCSLRAAVMEANALPGVEEIQLNGLTSTLTLGDWNEDDAGIGDLDIYEAVVISGPGIVDGGDVGYIFETHHEEGLVEFTQMQVEGFAVAIEQTGGGMVSVFEVGFWRAAASPQTAVRSRDGTLYFWSSTVEASSTFDNALDLGGDRADIQNATLIGHTEDAIVVRSGNVSMRHSTVMGSLNSTWGVSVKVFGGTMTMRGSIIYSREGCSQGVQSDGYNVTNVSSCASDPTDVVDFFDASSHRLEPDRSGAVAVVTPPGGSAAFNIAPSSSCTIGMQDARGGPRDLQGSCDAGAVETVVGACDLSNIEGGLEYCNLREMNLDGIDLSGARLGSADLAGTSLVGATLDGADLTGANLRDAILTGASAIGADFSESNTRGASFAGVDARQSIFRLAGVPAGPIDLRDADLRECYCGNLVDADLRGASLVGAFMSEGRILDSNVDGADFTGVGMWALHSGGLTGVPAAIPDDVRFAGGRFINGGVLIEGADFSGFDFDEVVIWYTLFVEVDFSGADLSYTEFGDNTALLSSVLDGAIVAGAVLPESMPDSSFVGVDFTGLDLQDVEFTRGTFVGADFTDVNLARANFYDAVMLWNTFDNTICPSGVNSDANGGNCDGQFPFGQPQAPGAPVPEEFQGREAEFTTLAGN